MSFDEQLRRVFDPLADRLRDEVAKHVKAAAGELSALARAQTEAEVASVRAETRSTDDGARERLVDTIRSMDRAGSLSEILDLVVNGAGREAARVGVLLVRGSTLSGWRFKGFGVAFDAGQSIEVPLESAAALAEAVKTNATVSGRAAPPFAQLPSEEPCLAVPIAIAGQVVAVVYADQGTSPIGELPNATIEVLARHAARCLEALTTIKAARALTEVAANRSSFAVSSVSGRESETDEADTAARRYAKLLISEIRLYHEAAVVAGRRERDLATRLGGEIARARVMYEERISDSVRQGTDYFHEEVVRTLANGDPTLLQLA